MSKVLGRTSQKRGQTTRKVERRRNDKYFYDHNPKTPILIYCPLYPLAPLRVVPPAFCALVAQDVEYSVSVQVAIMAMHLNLGVPVLLGQRNALDLVG